MKEVFLNFAKYNEEADKAIIGILSKLSNEDREKNRKSYYGSLSALTLHILGGTFYMLSLIKGSLPKDCAALKSLEALAKVEIPEVKKLGEGDWKKVVAGIKTADKAYVDFAASLSDNDFSIPVKLDWYKGKPAEVPLYFMLQQLVAHGTHHRGQISQILDSLKIDNDYSGINVKFLK